jgi:mRNA-degrading endonuclease RelE of RelBE toxin-antitoxin system
MLAILADFRGRVSNYRIIYEFDHELLYITVIAKRDQVYREVRRFYSTNK